MSVFSGIVSVFSRIVNEKCGVLSCYTEWSECETKNPGFDVDSAGFFTSFRMTVGCHCEEHSLNAT